MRIRSLNQHLLIKNQINFLSIITSIPFISKKEDDLKTLYFDLCQIKEFMMIELINNRSRGEISETRHLIKKAYNKLNSNCSKGCYFMLKVVCFPVSEAIVESWGSVIDEIVKSKRIFKEQVDSESTDNTEKLCFIRLNGPESGKINNRKLFKRALCLMYNGSEFESHFRYLSKQTLEKRNLLLLQKN